MKRKLEDTNHKNGDGDDGEGNERLVSNLNLEDEDQEEVFCDDQNVGEEEETEEVQEEDDEEQYRGEKVNSNHLVGGRSKKAGNIERKSNSSSSSTSKGDTTTQGEEVGGEKYYDNDNGNESEATLRKKKLELNRIASRESRKRKKRRLEELQRSVLFLTHENHQLREQNELLRQMLVGRLPGGNSSHNTGPAGVRSGTTSGPGVSQATGNTNPLASHLPAGGGGANNRGGNRDRGGVPISSLSSFTPVGMATPQMNSMLTNQSNTNANNIRYG